MHVFANVQMDLQPVAVVWKEGGQTKANIQRDYQTAMAFYLTNNLWGNDGQLFAEDGSELKGPEKPQA